MSNERFSGKLLMKAFRNISKENRLIFDNAFHLLQENHMTEYSGIECYPHTSEPLCVLINTKSKDQDDIAIFDSSNEVSIIIIFVARKDFFLFRDVHVKTANIAHIMWIFMRSGNIASFFVLRVVRS